MIMQLGTRFGAIIIFTTLACSYRVFFFLRDLEDLVYPQTVSDHPWFRKSSDDTDRAFHPRFSLSNSEDVLEQIDTTARIQCGAFKCFVPSKSDPEYGLLIAQDFYRRDTEFKNFSSVEGGWILAQVLQKEYGIHHFLKAPPIKMDGTQELADTLNLMIQEANSDIKRRPFGVAHPREKIKRTYSIQEAKKAPTTSLLVGCNQPKFLAAKAQVPSFVAQLRADYVTDSASRTAFAHKLLEDAEVAIRIAITHRRMLEDFQVLVTPTGNLHHLDFDRCFESEQRLSQVISNSSVPLYGKEEFCLEKFRTFSSELVVKLKKGDSDLSLFFELYH